MIKAASCFAQSAADRPEENYQDIYRNEVSTQNDDFDSLAVKLLGGQINAESCATLKQFTNSNDPSAVRFALKSATSIGRFPHSIRSNGVGSQIFKACYSRSGGSDFCNSVENVPEFQDSGDDLILAAAFIKRHPLLCNESHNTKSDEYLARAANLGNPNALFSQADKLYASGNQEEAFALLNKAAKQGDKRAIFALQENYNYDFLGRVVEEEKQYLINVPVVDIYNSKLDLIGRRAGDTRTNSFAYMPNKGFTMIDKSGDIWVKSNTLSSALTSDRNDQEPIFIKSLKPNSSLFETPKTSTHNAKSRNVAEAKIYETRDSGRVRISSHSEVPIWVDNRDLTNRLTNHDVKIYWLGDDKIDIYNSNYKKVGEIGGGISIIVEGEDRVAGFGRLNRYGSNFSNDIWVPLAKVIPFQFGDVISQKPIGHMYATQNSYVFASPVGRKSIDRLPNLKRVEIYEFINVESLTGEQSSTVYKINKSMSDQRWVHGNLTRTKEVRTNYCTRAQIEGIETTGIDIDCDIRDEDMEEAFIRAYNYGASNR